MRRLGSHFTNDSSNMISDRDVALVARDTTTSLIHHECPTNGEVRSQVDTFLSPFVSSQPSLQIIRESEVTPRETADVGARRSIQPPGLVRQVSHKISATFGNPTVVHRAKLCTRPSVVSLSGTPRAVDDPNALSTAAVSMLAVRSPVQVEHLSPQDDTDPSSYNNSGSVSAGDRSTGKTSVDSIRSLGKVGDTVRDNPLTPIDETPTERDDESGILDACRKPTIASVESAANAKIFFETYFNAMLSEEATPRSLRRRELELRLQTETLSSEQRQQERYTWATQESNHLRQNRVLKSKTNRITGSTGVDIAGYQVVRILGKGSFGVVRLVREKEEALPTVEARSTSRGVFRSTLDGQVINSRDARRSRKQVYAMKVIRKSDMLRNSQEGHLRAERDFLVASERSRWVVPLIASFQDSTNLYLVMDYMVGGDFLGLLFRKDVLKEKKARWYIAEMILCVEEAHRLRWIHRDVKPDNFLISASGHLKISDFGLAFDGHWSHDQSFFTNHRLSLMERLGIEVDGDSLDRKEGASIAASMAMANVLGSGKRREQIQVMDSSPSENETILQWRNRVGNRKLARSVVGTSQYMAPEVIRGELYDGRCDWWSIGIILYEVGNFGRDWN